MVRYFVATAMAAVFAVGITLAVVAARTSNAGAVDVPPLDTRWEYKYVTLLDLTGEKSSEELVLKGTLGGQEKAINEKALKKVNELGAERWELFFIGNGAYFFKRPIR